MPIRTHRQVFASKSACLLSSSRDAGLSPDPAWCEVRGRHLAAAGVEAADHVAALHAVCAQEGGLASMRLEAGNHFPAASLPGALKSLSSMLPSFKGSGRPINQGTVRRQQEAGARGGGTHVAALAIMPHVTTMTPCHLLSAMDLLQWLEHKARVIPSNTSGSKDLTVASCCSPHPVSHFHQLGHHPPQRGAGGHSVASPRQPG